MIQNEGTTPKDKIINNKLRLNEKNYFINSTNKCIDTSEIETRKEFYNFLTEVNKIQKNA